MVENSKWHDKAQEAEEEEEIEENIAARFSVDFWNIWNK